ncbi:DUF3159 domain-containing protein [Jatrophihabitans lederbergiae]|uniref:DUF3159 domain-containing protein n=1 Tax=Jatrophihabitans lederbergiae TaxID=3075547 RepID=A0ABU2J709_9ACTN|nr:DUF3159 domain-containing protein [Jatrophihabitans sp. DSM 44399]MDT0260774.1 DUF3159 domain-containing protein [Jatrophihabitans sp. DSM 44399]
MTTPPTGELRDRTRQQLLGAMGGWSGTVVAAIPPVVFVIANAISGLRQAIIVALISGVVVAGYRLVRRQPLQQALTGLFTVAVAAAIAARTGQARGFFLVGIVGAVAYAVVFAASLLVRRPLVGLIWEFLDPSPLPEGRRWHKVPVLRRAYDIATCAALAMFAARAVVQLSLFKDNRTGLLAVAKIAMGFPLYILVVAGCFWIVRRARRTLEPMEPVTPPDTPVVSPTPGVSPMPGDERSGGADRTPDGGLRLGQGDE